MQSQLVGEGPGALCERSRAPATARRSRCGRGRPPRRVPPTTCARRGPEPARPGPQRRYRPRHPGRAAWRVASRARQSLGLVGRHHANSARIRRSILEPRHLPVHRDQLRRLQDVERCTVVVGQEQWPVGEEPGGDGVGRRLHEELHWLAAVGVGGEPVGAVAVVEALDRPRRASQIWPSAVKPTIWSPPRWTSAATSDPDHAVGIVPRNRNHVVSHRPPQASPGANGSNGRRSASDAGTGSPWRWWAATSRGTRRRWIAGRTTVVRNCRRVLGSPSIEPQVWHP